MAKPESANVLTPEPFLCVVDCDKRIIVKPEVITEEQLSDLRGLLQTAIDFQRELAKKCDSVLCWGKGAKLEETAEAFFIEHEPAHPIPWQLFFDPTQPKTPPGELVRAAKASCEGIPLGSLTDTGA